MRRLSVTFLALEAGARECDLIVISRGPTVTRLDLTDATSNAGDLLRVRKNDCAEE